VVGELVPAARGAQRSTTVPLGGVVGVVCHGPAGLVPIRLSDGHPRCGQARRRVTDEEELAVTRDELIVPTRLPIAAPSDTPRTATRRSPRTPRAACRAPGVHQVGHRREPAGGNRSAPGRSRG
jgi:hypothetical protein